VKEFQFHPLINLVTLRLREELYFVLLYYDFNIDKIFTFMILKKEVKIGLLVLLSLAAFVWGFQFMKGSNIFVPGERYYGTYSQVDGLNEGAPIFYRGFKVGMVQDIKLHPAKRGKFLISFVLTEEFHLPKNTVAQIYSIDLMGSKAIQLIEGDSAVPLVPGDTLSTNTMGDLIHQMGMEVLPIKDKAERLLVHLDSVLTGISEVFSEQNKSNLDMAILDFTLSMNNFKNMSAKLDGSLGEYGEIGRSFQNIESFTETLNNQSENLNTTMENLTSLSENLKNSDVEGLISQLDSTLKMASRTIDKITSGNGTLGKLINDQSLYLNLTDASANLDRLLADVRHNPERYVHFSAINFGRKVYINADDELASQQGIVFKVQVAESSIPLDIKNSVVLGDMPVFEDTDGNLYLYTVGQTYSYSEALSLMDRLQPVFPAAVVVAFKDGKSIRLKRALKKINIKN